MTDPIVIAGIARTPMGSFQGVCRTWKATDLGATAVRARSGAGGRRTRHDRADPDGLRPARGPRPGAGAAGGDPCRDSASMSRRRRSTRCAAPACRRRSSPTTCCARIGGYRGGGRHGEHDRRALSPPRARGGARIGHDAVEDSMFLDGLEDAYETGKLMGAFAEETARAYQFSREEQDALRDPLADAGPGRASKRRVRWGDRAGYGRDAQGQRDGFRRRAAGQASADKIPTLKPAFAKDGTITAANASSISDGAAAPVMTRASVAEAGRPEPAARVAGPCGACHRRPCSRLAPVSAMRYAARSGGWSMDDVDCSRSTRPSPSSALIAQRELGDLADKLNVNGGACALGHPIGASGACSPRDAG